MTTARIGFDNLGGAFFSAALSLGFWANDGLESPIPVLVNSASAKAVAIVFIHASLKQYGVELSRTGRRVNQPQPLLALLFCIIKMNNG
jgi:hypothetical protein